MNTEPKETRVLLASATAVEQRGTVNRWVTASLAVHALVIAAVLVHRVPKLISVERPGAATGHNLVLTFTPGNSAPAATLQAKERPVQKPTPAPAIAAPVKVAPTPSTPSDTPGTGTESGDDALGDGDITLALEMNHPYPKPDLSHLPSGTRGDVVVDVVIDAQGHIAKSTLARGLGDGVDAAVLATIQQWTFQPATRNGKPVPSEQELLFHYERG
ncbi:TonB family protein [Granulicella sp. 5B5]|uniref:TonB family protein n=1 Tax=Granulicella sp. 5B5 TaxID=1617967 RepID=UPI0015F3E5A2|nr:TonB family protein [Granulicella sp. 5B5]QMV19575.1 TonB family protein [Granulicella sp. 5B5]